jgi:hypothetical protein
VQRNRTADTDHVARHGHRARAGAVGAVLAVLAAGAVAATLTTRAVATTGVVRPPVGARFDYQIGGGYPPAATVRFVDRDRGDRPAPGRYNICYVNAFQTQPQETAWWRAHHRNLLLHTSTGREVTDPGWGETLLDTSTGRKRAALADIVGGWVAGCARHGFQAIEFDNLDSYARSHRLLTAADAVAYSRLLTRGAHLHHIAAAQKNAAELSRLRARTGFDFAIAEECQVYSECHAYTRMYGRHVIEIEYTDNPRRYFRAACDARGAASRSNSPTGTCCPPGRTGTCAAGADDRAAHRCRVGNGAGLRDWRDGPLAQLAELRTFNP